VLHEVRVAASAVFLPASALLLRRVLRRVLRP
jgi:hypothetical protein